MEIGFSFGSNVGDRIQILSTAREKLLSYEDCEFVGSSPVYETEPVGVKPEYEDLPYLNSVLVVETSASPEDWLVRLQTIEKTLGREREEDRFAPRTLDIDILYCDDQIIDSGGLSVPHPRWAERRFVVQPLADVRPRKIMPGTGQQVQEMLRSLEDAKTVAVFSEQW